MWDYGRKININKSHAALLKDLNLLQNSFHISLTRFYFKITWLFHSLWHFLFLATMENYDDDDDAEPFETEKNSKLKIMQKKLFFLMYLKARVHWLNYKKLTISCAVWWHKKSTKWKNNFFLFFADKRKAEATKRRIFHHTRLSQVWIERERAEETANKKI